jgi:MYXO-CTERM domain-containing protein
MRYILARPFARSANISLTSLVALIGLFSPLTWGQIIISTPAVPYFEDFNDLSTNDATWTSNSTVAGIYAAGTSTITPSYRLQNTPKTSFGVNGVNSESDRALGISLIDNGSSDTVWYAMRFVNNTGVTLNSLSVSYYAERYWAYTDSATRFNEGFEFYGAVNPVITARPDGLEWVRQTSLDYTPAEGIVTDSPGNRFFSVSANAWSVDGNHPDYRTFITGTLAINGGLANGQEYWLLWGNAVFGLSKISDGIAVDDLTVTFATSAIPEPSAYAALAGMLMLALAGLRRRRVPAAC